MTASTAPVAETPPASRAGVQVTIDGKQLTMPNVTVRKAKAWRARLMTAIGKTQLPDATSYSADWGTALANAASEEMLDLLCAFDETRALSLERTAAAHKRSLEDRLSEPELFAAFLEVLRAVFPYIEDPLAMVKQLIADHLREQRGQRALAQINELQRTAGEFQDAADAIVTPAVEEQPG